MDTHNPPHERSGGGEHDGRATIAGVTLTCLLLRKRSILLLGSASVCEFGSVGWAKLDGLTVSSPMVVKYSSPVFPAMLLLVVAHATFASGEPSSRAVAGSYTTTSDGDVTKLQEQALSGDPEAANRLANYFAFSIARDSRRERLWLRVAASLNSVDAQRSLGIALLADGGEASTHEGIGWLLRAIETGDANAGLELAAFSAEHITSCCEHERIQGWLEQSAKTGRISSMVTLANYLLQGEQTRDSRVKALAWFEAACRSAQMHTAEHARACQSRDDLASRTSAAEREQALQIAATAIKANPQ